MKKRLLILIISLLVLVPNLVFAKTVSTNLEETLTAEDLKLENKDYEETDDQVTIYMFRGQGCSHCLDFLTYLNSISKEYGDKFKLRAYEVWNNEDNINLQGEVAQFLGTNVNKGSVPYVIVGKTTIVGFGEDDKKVLTDAIDSEYKKTTKYDVMKEMKPSKKEKKSKGVVTYIIIGVLAALVIFFLTRKSED